MITYSPNNDGAEMTSSFKNWQSTSLFSQKGHASTCIFRASVDFDCANPLTHVLKPGLVRWLQNEDGVRVTGLNVSGNLPVASSNYAIW